jgi:hypothetical protein
MFRATEIDGIFSDRQLQQMIYKIQSFSIIRVMLIALMMEMELVSDMLDSINHLTQPSARENFIEEMKVFIRGERLSIRTLILDISAR